MRYEIQNYLGEVILPSVSEEELTELKNVSAREGLNYFQDGPGILDMFQRQLGEGIDVTQSRIVKIIAD